MAMRRGRWISLLALLCVVLGIPLLFLYHEAKRTGRPLGTYIERAMPGFLGKEQKKATSPGMAAKKGDWVRFLEPVPIGDPMGETKPWITHVALVDLDGDTLKDVLVCDAKANQIRWIRQSPAGVFAERALGREVRGPAHVTPCDVDRDGDLDLLVAKMGMIFPNNDKIGAVVLLENLGNAEFENRVLVDKIARVTDIQCGDFDADGLIDLAVGQFGYDDGEIRWMKNKGNREFESHILLRLSGTIHTPVGDMDRDGDPDIVALVSQEWEEIYVFVNDGRGNFKPNMIYGSTNEDFGSSGISLVDLDQDGDLDILYTNGDAFDYIPPGPRPWHGVQWLENKGGLAFDYHRIGDFPGAYSAVAVDVDRDGDLDVCVVSCFNKWEDPAAQSMIWFENQGQMAFIQHNLVSSPTHLLTLESADMDGDGWPDLVSGGFYAYPPYDRMARVLLWRNIWPQRETLKQEK